MIIIICKQKKEGMLWSHRVSHVVVELQGFWATFCTYSLLIFIVKGRMSRKQKHAYSNNALHALEHQLLNLTCQLNSFQAFEWAVIKL